MAVTWYNKANNQRRNTHGPPEQYDIFFNFTLYLVFNFMFNWDCCWGLGIDGIQLYVAGYDRNRNHIGVPGSNCFALNPIYILFNRAQKFCALFFYQSQVIGIQFANGGQDRKECRYPAMLGPRQGHLGV